MIRFVSFDLDGTLADDAFDKLVWNEKIPQLYAQKNSLTLENAKRDVYAEYYKALYVENVHCWTDISYWFDRLELENWQGLIEEMKQDVFIFPDALETLDYLKAKYQLVVLSNSEEKFLKFKIEAENIGGYFSHIISAPSRFNLTKNHSRVYQKMLKVLGASADELVHVGDDYEMDYLSAQQAGIQAYHLKRGTQKESDNHITKLTDLKKIL